MTRRIITTALAFVLASVLASAEGEDGDVIPVKVGKSEIVKTGWNVGLVPAFNYNNDLGFQAGVLGQIYHNGDG